MNCSRLVLVYKPSLKPKIECLLVSSDLLSAQSCNSWYQLKQYSRVSDAIRKADVNLLFPTAFFLFVCFRFKYGLPVRDLMCGYVRYCTHEIYEAGNCYLPEHAGNLSYWLS